MRGGETACKRGVAQGGKRCGGRLGPGCDRCMLVHSFYALQKYCLPPLEELGQVGQRHCVVLDPLPAPASAPAVAAVGIS